MQIVAILCLAFTVAHSIVLTVAKMRLDRWQANQNKRIKWINDTREAWVNGDFPNPFGNEMFEIMLNSKCNDRDVCHWIGEMRKQIVNLEKSH